VFRIVERKEFEHGGLRDQIRASASPEAAASSVFLYAKQVHYAYTSLQYANFQIHATVGFKHFRSMQ
jgi:hypothetical protein